MICVSDKMEYMIVLRYRCGEVLYVGEKTLKIGETSTTGLCLEARL